MLKFKRFICGMFHGHEDMMHPINGVVKCRRCHLEYAVTWGAIPKPRTVLLADLRRVEERA